MKNLERAVLIAVMAAITIVGSSSLDHFVSVTGAFCGLPIAFVYPAIIHLRLHPNLSLKDKVFDGIVIVVGLMLTITITINAFLTWGNT